MNETEQDDQTKEQSVGSEEWVNFFMQAIKEDYEPLSHKQATSWPIPLDLSTRIHALEEHKSDNFVILYNHGNPFVSIDNNNMDASSVDTKSVWVETVDGAKKTTIPLLKVKILKVKKFWRK